MLARARAQLPNGPLDLARQLVLFCGAYWLYQLVRGVVDGRAAAAFDNGREVIHIERGLGLFFEPAVNAWASANDVIADITSWMYVNAHFGITTLALAWIYLRRNERFYFVRNMFMVSMVLALILYMLVPTAPPRMPPEWGFTDSVAQPWIAGSTNVCSVRSSAIRSRPCWKASAARPSTAPRTYR